MQKFNATFLHTPKVILGALALVFLTALLLRLYAIDGPPLDFQPVRQYRSALIARAFYYELLPAVPEWKKELARANLREEGILEPPLMEAITAALYRVIGYETLIVPRLLSVLFWLLGGVWLYLLAQALVSRIGAVIATLFYLFLPFGISASRSFQPDPLMIMLQLAGLFFIWKYHTQPTRTNLWSATVLSAAAIFIKPVCVFVLVSAFLVPALARQRNWKALLNRDTAIFGLCLLPTLLFYLFGIYLTDLLRSQAETSFLPHLVLMPAFWQGWFAQIDAVLGVAMFGTALVGLVLIPPGLPRAFLLSLWLGYVVFGLVFTYHIHTHDYYQLQLILLAAISIGAAGDWLIKQRQRVPQWAWILGVCALVLIGGFGYARNLRERFSYPSPRLPKMAETIGELTHHTARAIFLGSAYGKPLAYHGEMAGTPWPGLSDLRAEQLRGKQISTAERLAPLLDKYSAEYFVVTDMPSFKAQPDLQAYLVKHFVLLARTKEYWIFALKQTSVSP